MQIVHPGEHFFASIRQIIAQPNFCKGAKSNVPLINSNKKSVRLVA